MLTSGWCPNLKKFRRHSLNQTRVSDDFTTYHKRRTWRLKKSSSFKTLSAQPTAAIRTGSVSRVEEKFEGKTAWSGIVEVFAFVNHPQAKYAYAWTYRDCNQNRTTVVLKIPPVDSPQSAVKVAIASKARS